MNSSSLPSHIDNHRCHLYANINVYLNLFLKYHRYYVEHYHYHQQNPMNTMSNNTKQHHWQRVCTLLSNSNCREHRFDDPLRRQWTSLNSYDSPIINIFCCMNFELMKELMMTSVWNRMPCNKMSNCLVMTMRRNFVEHQRKAMLTKQFSKRISFDLLLTGGCCCCTGCWIWKTITSLDYSIVKLPDTVIYVPFPMIIDATYQNKKSNVFLLIIISNWIPLVVLSSDWLLNLVVTIDVAMIPIRTAAIPATITILTIGSICFSFQTEIKCRSICFSLKFKEQERKTKTL